MNNAAHIQAPEPASPRLKPADWLWRPWYAKLWWSAIPVWWIGMAASTRIAPLEAFYDSAAAGFLNVLFFPMMALMVLGIGYAQHWLAQFPKQGDGTSLSDETVASLSYSRRSVSGPLWAFAAAGCIARTTGIAGVCFTAFGLMGFSG
ncbi:hypothetical protein [Sphingobium sp. CFD-2]|uniref:hypothetical protein n=1 Tax=Sphingobium sp. CFD-2 TaxID=2878542 RepID=UPI00214C9C16|nr:hypothetical protein [Sphingobium sp. CFD-2]